jgi:hypothetical protein
MGDSVQYSLSLPYVSSSDREWAMHDCVANRDRWAAHVITGQMIQPPPQGGSTMQRRQFMASGFFGLVAAGLCLLATGPAQAASLSGPPNAEPMWEPQLVATTQFVVLSEWKNEAVFDKETGLVWELSPAKNSLDWTGAQEYCLNLAAGGRKGWRLPSVHELASLVDPGVAPPGPTLRAGHPFTNVQSSRYWGAPPNPQYAAPPWFVFFSDGRTKLADQKTGKALTWCVRTAGYDLSDQQ